MIEKNADGILVVRPDGTIRFVNPAATAGCSAGRAEDLCWPPFGIPIVPGETTEIDLPSRAGRSASPSCGCVETEWEGEPALWPRSATSTERKVLEAQLRQKVEELAEADRHKDEFLAMLAHELRNPLGPIRNALHIMKGARPTRNSSPRWASHRA